MMEIKLTRGMVAVVDEEDFDALSRYSWHAAPGHKTWYARRYENGEPIYMHRQIVGGSPERVDHRDENGLNNTRKNLREATHSQNLFHRGKQVNNTSGFKGVFWDKSRGKWLAGIGVGGRFINLGRFDDPVDAALAYDRGARAEHGSFAGTNFVEAVY